MPLYLLCSLEIHLKCPKVVIRMLTCKRMSFYHSLFIVHFNTSSVSFADEKGNFLLLFSNNCNLFATESTEIIWQLHITNFKKALSQHCVIRSVKVKISDPVELTHLLLCLCWITELSHSTE